MGAAPFYVPNGSARGVQLLHVLTNTCYFKKADSQDFPGGPVVKNLSFYCRGAQVQGPVGKLRFLMLRDEAEKKKKMPAILIVLKILLTLEQGISHLYLHWALRSV